MIRPNITKGLLGLTATAVLAVSLIFSSGASVAQGELEITGTAVTSDFPSTITFSLQASSASEIIDIRLHYLVERDSYARVISEIKPSFVPATKASASWTWDLRQSGGMPPGSAVEYWWTVRDADGAVVSSLPATFIFADGRFSWQQTTRGNLTVYWYGRSESGAQILLESALDGLAELENETGAHLRQPVQIYVYADTAAMLGAMMFPQEWTGAATYTDQATIVFGLTDNWSWNAKTIVHELAHMVSYQLTRGPYGVMPNWLSEGFSMYAEGEPDIYLTSALVSALNDGTTLTVRSICVPFSADPGRSYLSYAQSYSLVEYLAGTYGQEKLLSLFTVFARGADYDGALLEVYGFDMDGLYARWLPYAMIKYVGMMLV